MTIEEFKELNRNIRKDLQQIVLDFQKIDYVGRQSKNLLLNLLEQTNCHKVKNNIYLCSSEEYYCYTKFLVNLSIPGIHEFIDFDYKKWTNKEQMKRQLLDEILLILDNYKNELEDLIDFVSTK